MEIDRDTLSNYLRTASEAFNQMAYDSDKDNQPRVAEQFRRQASEAWKISEALERGDRVLITGL